MLLVIEVLTAAFLIILAFYKYSFQYWRKLKVPYVVPTIPWGNYPNLIERSDHFGQKLVRMYFAMKKQGHKLFGVYLFCKPCLVLVDPQYVKLILSKDFAHFSDRGLYYNEKDDPVSAHLISLNGPKWRKLRTKLTPTFTIGKIKMLFKIFVECGNLLERTLESYCENRTAFNAKILSSSFSTDIIVNCAFGLEVDEVRKKEFSAHSRKALDFDMIRSFALYIGGAFPSLCRKLGFRQVNKTSGDFFIDVVGSTVDYREKNNIVRNDFLQLLINLKNEGSDDGEEFTLKQMAAQCFIFFLAGYETSATTMSFALYEIAANPHVYDKAVEEVTTVLDKYNGEITYDAVQEMTYLGQIVDETLRLHSPAYYITRICIKDYYVPEYNFSVKKGSTVIIPIRALHADPDFYPEPDKFKPERFSPANKHNIDQYCYLPFGEGPRICIGLRFARMEIKTGIAMILRNYKLSVNSKTIVPLQINPTTFLYDAKGGLWLNCERITNKCKAH